MSIPIQSLEKVDQSWHGNPCIGVKKLDERLITMTKGNATNREQKWCLISWTKCVVLGMVLSRGSRSIYWLELKTAVPFCHLPRLLHQTSSATSKSVFFHFSQLSSELILLHQMRVCKSFLQKIPHTLPIGDTSNMELTHCIGH